MGRGSAEGLVITLDGPSGSGKSSVAIKLACHFGIPCLDTGAMYRSVALKGIEKKIELENDEGLSKLASSLHFRFGFDEQKPWVEISEDGKKYIRMGKEIRTPEISLAASKIAKLKKVRAELVKKQQQIGSKHGAVVEGRDAGTVIFPSAPIKFFITASPEERARRRHLELHERYGVNSQSYEEVLKEIKQRDKQDSERVESPLKPAEDAIFVDTTGLNFEAVVEHLVKEVDQRLKHCEITS